VPADLQQRWIWNGVATGAEAILFWCWRDEVFGKESGGFGLTGNDGCARARLDAMRKTGRLVREHAEFLSGYRMNHPRIGIYFSPQTNFLYWSQHGQTRAIGDALKGYSIALTRLNLPYLFVEENHLHVLDQLDVLFMPHNLVLDAEAEEALTRFVQRGGLLLTESECGAFDSTGIWRYPEERFLSRLADISEEGRRSLHADQTIQIEIEGYPYRQHLRRGLYRNRRSRFCRGIPAGCASNQRDAHPETTSSVPLRRGASPTRRAYLSTTPSPPTPHS